MTATFLVSSLGLEQMPVQEIPVVQDPSLEAVDGVDDVTYCRCEFGERRPRSERVAPYSKKPLSTLKTLRCARLKNFFFFLKKKKPLLV